MPRPRKWRVVEFVPDELYFMPVGRRKCDLDEEVLKVEEIEAVRLKDVVLLDQDACAQRMQVSRQTFQRILGEARAKIARALIEGKALRIAGGDFTRNVCRVACSRCGRRWEEPYEKYCNNRKDDYQCPHCGSVEIACCQHRDGFCARCGHQRL